MVSYYKYLGIWLDDCLSFKLQVNNLLRKLRVKLGFFFRNKSCFSVEARKRLVSVTFLPVLDYGDLIYVNAPAHYLNKLDAAYHSALRFVKYSLITVPCMPRQVCLHLLVGGSVIGTCSSTKPCWVNYLLISAP